MPNLAPELHVAVDTIVAAIRQRMAGSASPLVVALDGGSGAGKSTLAQSVAETVDAVVIPGDDFFAADISDAGWEARDPIERARDAIDWRRLRAEAIEPLRAGRTARWHAFDFASGLRRDGTYPMQTAWTVREPAAVAIVDGAYSARPELADLLDLTVLVDVPIAGRHRRLAAREAPEFLAAWHARWDAAEEYYFREVRPPSSFDLVVRTST